MVQNVISRTTKLPVLMIDVFSAKWNIKNIFQRLSARSLTTHGDYKTWVGMWVASEGHLSPRAPPLAPRLPSSLQPSLTIPSLTPHLHPPLMPPPRYLTITYIHLLLRLSMSLWLGRLLIRMSTGMACCSRTHLLGLTTIQLHHIVLLGLPLHPVAQVTAA